MLTRLPFILALITLATCIHSQTTVPLTVDRNVLTEELLSRFTESVTSKIDDQLKTAEGFVLDNALIREMLVPYKEYGINPDDGEYYKSIHSIYTSIKTDPDYDPEAEIKTKVRNMINTRISNYAKSFIDKESQAMFGQLQALFNDANKKIVGLVEAMERMYELPPDDPEIETKWANELKKLGIKGKITDLIGDFENVFGQAQARYAKPIEMATMIKNGLSSDDPTNKIEILFEFGEKFGEDLPLVGTIVSSLFKLGKEVLAAAKRAGGILERNLGQGCISTDGEYVQGAAMKQKFYQSFPHIDRACPLSQSKTAGVYQFIYFNESGASELLFYHNNNWLGSLDASQDGTHAGDGDIRALRAFLNTKGENAKADDLAFLHAAYVKAPGFLHYRKELNEKFNEIRSLSARTYGAVSYCDANLVENFMMDKIGLDWLTRLMKDRSFDFGNIRIFTQSTVDDLVDQMLTNRYLSLNYPNLDRLDDIIENLKDNIPVVIHGSVVESASRRPLGGVQITADVPLLFEGAACMKNTSASDGRFTLLLNIPEAYEGKVGFTASLAGVRESKELTVNIERNRSYEVNFFLETGDQEVSELVISPETTTLKIGESVAFVVTAKYVDGTELDVTSSAMSASTFTAERVGQFRVIATFRNQSISAVVTVEAEPEQADEPEDEPGPDGCDQTTQRWNAELEKCECLPPLLENEDGKCVDPAELEDELGDEVNECEELNKELILLLEAASQLNEAYLDQHRVFLMHRDRFYKEVNDRAAEVCENQMIGYTYYTATQSADRMKTLEEELVSVLIDVTYITTVCAELAELLNARGFGTDVTQWVEFFDVSAALAAMSDKLVEFGCNTDDVAQSGEGVAPGELDPNFTGKGGTSTEIPGDGKDNDGDGLQDEIPVAGLPGYNITIALYDSGNAKDDVFNLSIQGRGSLGLTPAGGLRSYGLNLPPGTYRAEVLVVVAPDDIGTFTINILQNGISIGNLTGEPGEGSVSVVVFEVE